MLMAFGGPPVSDLANTFVLIIVNGCGMTMSDHRGYIRQQEAPFLLLLQELSPPK
jgi:hypothetical protein